jgi:hypothetical protein
MVGIKGMKWGKRKSPPVPTGKVYSRVRCPMCGMLVSPIKFTPTLMHKSQIVVCHYHGRGRIEIERKSLGEVEHAYKETVLNKIHHIAITLLGIELFTSSDLRDSYNKGFESGLLARSDNVTIPIKTDISIDDVPIIIKPKVIV